ncbi:MAG: hypothetical protein ICV72_14605, partial [Aldersonia sp.]|nr:hypothetical protein [Aldersonia sp.]
MRPTISQLRTWDLGALASAAQSLYDAARRLDAVLDALARRMADARNWRGRTHDAVARKVEEELDHGREVLAVLDRIADDAGDAARALEHARSFTLHAVEIAVADGFLVADSGEVNAPGQARQADADYHANVIGSALDDVERLDTRYGNALSDSTADLVA